MGKPFITRKETNSRGKEVELKYKRTFDGEVGYKMSPFQKKALKAYLKGKSFFTFGKDVKTGQPHWHKTPIKLVRID
jgi:hypothetical protein